MKLKFFLPAVAMLLPVLLLSSCKDDNEDDENSLRPIVTSTYPLNSAEAIARNATLTATFSMDMDEATVSTSTFTLKQGNTSIPGTVEYADKVATFTPLGTLGALTSYTATITNGVESLSGEELASNHVWSFTTGGSADGIIAVNLGTAGNYVILAKQALSNNPTSAIIGDIGLSPAATSYITGLALTDAIGYATSEQVSGFVHAADMADPTPANLTAAVENMMAAYSDAAGRSLPDFINLAAGSIGGLTLSPGLYKWTQTVTMSSDITLSGNSTDVWIFQIDENLAVSSASKVILSDGAKAENIFWQVTGQATFGASSHFEGVILSKTGITLQSGASLYGRALAQTAVVLDNNEVTQP
ncbi:MAG: DUF3494 domain-containing protein [Bacteroidales bacterium]|nr:DUF3494 domain-containing protein [Bacteroidales bacterium]MBN2749916.1 DUF3494 domain-containing protein [Bacteroidales bacterium]